MAMRLCDFADLWDWTWFGHFWPPAVSSPCTKDMLFLGGVV